MKFIKTITNLTLVLFILFLTSLNTYAVADDTDLSTEPIEQNIAIVILVGPDIFLQQKSPSEFGNIKTFNAASWGIEKLLRTKYVDRFNKLHNPDGVTQYKASVVDLTREEESKLLTAYYNEDVIEKYKILQENTENEEDLVELDWDVVNKNDAIVFSDILGEKYDKLMLVVKRNKNSPGYGINYIGHGRDTIYHLNAVLNMALYNLRDPKLIAKHKCCFGRKLSFRPVISGKTITAHHSIDTFKDIGAVDMKYIQSTMEYLFSYDIIRYVYPMMFSKPRQKMEKDEFDTGID